MSTDHVIPFVRRNITEKGFGGALLLRSPSPLTQARKDLNAGSAAPQKVLKNMLNEMNETILRNAYIFPLIKPTFYQRGGSLQLLISLNTKSAAILDSALRCKVTSLIAQLHRLNTVTAVVGKLIIVNGYFMLMTKC